MDWDRLINKPIVRCEVQGCVLPTLKGAKTGTSRVANRFVRLNDKLIAVCDQHNLTDRGYEILSFDDGCGEYVAQGIMAR